MHQRYITIPLLALLFVCLPAAAGALTISLHPQIPDLSAQTGTLTVEELNLDFTSLTGTPLTSRGDLIELQEGSTALRGFLISGQTNQSADATILSRFEQRLAGAFLERHYAGHRLTLTSTALTGSNTQDEGANQGALLDMHLRGVLIDKLLISQLEFAHSLFDMDATDADSARPGYAWQGSLSGQSGGLDYSLGVVSHSSTYQSVLTPDASSNRREYAVHLGGKTGSSRLTLDARHAHDNIDHVDDAPVLHTSSLNLGYSLHRHHNSAVFARTRLRTQRSTDEPDGQNPIRTRSQTSSFGFMLSRGTWSLTPSYTVTTTNDLIGTAGRSHSHSVTLTGNWKPLPAMSVKPGATYRKTRTRRTNRVTHDWLGTFSATWLISDALKVKIRLSAKESRSNDASINASVYNAEARYSWNLDNLDETLPGCVGFRASYDSTIDRISGSSSQEYATLLTFRLAMPVN